MEQRQAFQKMMQKKKKERHIPYTFHKKIDSKLIIDLSVKFKTIKLLEDNTGENLDEPGYNDDFLNTAPTAWFMKDVISKLDFIKIKYCSLNANFKRMRR